MVSKIFDYLYKDATVYLERKYLKAIRSKQILAIQENMRNEMNIILEKQKGVEIDEHSITLDEKGNRHIMTDHGISAKDFV